MGDRARSGVRGIKGGRCPVCEVEKETQFHFLGKCGGLKDVRRMELRKMRDGLSEVWGGKGCWDWFWSKSNEVKVRCLLGGCFDEWIDKKEEWSIKRRREIVRVWYRGVSGVIEGLWKERDKKRRRKVGGVV